ncbi:MAG: hypothetical protein CM1200mP41_25620 [Gammaproteobacteria bacterium]|nr:MAG: hypothetical protein CM1200mP41_25620 [Gammaproteobacteria bacterium]
MRIPPPDAIRRTRETSKGRSDPLIPAKEAGKGYYGDSLLQIIDHLLRSNRQLAQIHLMRSPGPLVAVYRTMKKMSATALACHWARF